MFRRYKLLAVWLLLVSIGSCIDHNRASPLTDQNGVPFVWCDNPQLVLAEANMPEPVQDALFEAIEYWNEKIGKDVFIFAGFDENPPPIPGIVVIQRQEVLTTMDVKACASTKIRQTNGCSRTALITAKTECMLEYINDPEILYTAFRHEFGHALGLDHSDFPEDLMYKSFNRRQTHPKEVSPEALTLLKKTYLPL